MNKSEAGRLGAVKTAEILAAQAIQRRNEYYSHAKICAAANCKTIISFEKKRLRFCSKSCSAKTVQRKRRKIHCSKCLGEINDNIPSRKCSSCRSVPKSFEVLVTNGSRKEFILKETGWICEICRFTEWLGVPIPLHVDHIDGNHLNKNRNNFRLLCPNCHALTPTYCRSKSPP
jgi:hypothetical protein